MDSLDIETFRGYDIIHEVSEYTWPPLIRTVDEHVKATINRSTKDTLDKKDKLVSMLLTR